MFLHVILNEAERSEAQSYWNQMLSGAAGEVET